MSWLLCMTLVYALSCASELWGAQILSHLVSAAGEKTNIAYAHFPRDARSCVMTETKGLMGETLLVRVGMLRRIVGHDSRRHHDTMEGRDS